MKEKDNSLIVIIISILAIGIAWVGTFFAFSGESNEYKSAMGDMFGVTNTLFSGLALAGIIFTILLQRKELALQRQELKESREELKRTATAQENSEKALNRQAENLKVSAKLSALNTLVNYYSEIEINYKKGIIQNPELDIAEIIKRRKEYAGRIEELLEAKESL